MNLDEFRRKLERLEKHEMEKIMAVIVYELGERLLAAIQDEIDRQNLIDTGTLWNSFTQGGDGNIWVFDQDRDTLTLEVGSNLTYAEYLNDGYTIEKGHFVPGYWNSVGKFIYDPDAKGGFWARPRSFIGRKYFDIALHGFQGGVKKLIENRLEKELERVMK